MARKKKVNKDIEQYDHADKKRLNNLLVGLVSANTEPYSTAPFEKEDNTKIAVRIIDDRGIESLGVISLL